MVTSSLRRSDSRARAAMVARCGSARAPSRRGRVVKQLSDGLSGDYAAFGRRPRRALLRPLRASSSASSSVTSSSALPFRASLKVMRTFAPFPSAICSPERSETKTLLRATNNLPHSSTRPRQPSEQDRRRADPSRSALRSSSQAENPQGSEAETNSHLMSCLSLHSHGSRSTRFARGHWQPCRSRPCAVEPRLVDQNDRVGVPELF